MNKIMIIGNLTKDVYSATTLGGKQYAKLSVAVNRTFGEQKMTDFFDVIAWNALAENCAKYLAKGDKVAVSGSAHIEEYEKDGQKRRNFTIQAVEIEFLRKAAERMEEKLPERKATQMTLEEVKEEDFPF